ARFTARFPGTYALFEPLFGLEHRQGRLARAPLVGAIELSFGEFTRGMLRECRAQQRTIAHELRPNGDHVVGTLQTLADGAFDTDASVGAQGASAVFEPTRERVQTVRQRTIGAAEPGAFRCFAG